MTNEEIESANHGYDDALEGRAAMLTDAAYVKGYCKGKEAALGFPDDGDHKYDLSKNK